MEIKENYDLSSKTTFHNSGGIVKRLYIPENKDEVINLLNNEFCNEEYIYIFSGGSNILINDEKVFDKVISTQKVNDKITKLNDKGNYYIGCSCRIQNVINTINKDGYGGFEELYSLPALFGGMIYMNAGIGGKNNALFTISDFIEEVEVIEIRSGNILWLNKNECLFGHRTSIFQNDKYFILGAKIKTQKQEINISRERINKRINKCKKIQEYGRGCFGTCFSMSSGRLLKIVKMIYRKKGKVSFAQNNANWFVNNGDGKFKDVLFLINKCKKIHRVFRKEIKCEVRIWK